MQSSVHNMVSLIPNPEIFGLSEKNGVAVVLSLLCKKYFDGSKKISNVGIRNW